MNMFVFIVFISNLLNFTLGQIDKNNYGPYNLNWAVFEKCKGPKQKDCGHYEIADSQNMSDVIFRLEFENACPISTARVTVSTIVKNNTTKKLFNYGLEKPCQHFVLGPILGHYDIHINMMDKSNIFLGPNFFYGTYHFKVTVMNKVQNFICVKSVIHVEKKLN